MLAIRSGSALLYAFEMTSALTSLQNPLFKDLRRAASRGELTADGCVVAEGVHLLEEALASPVEIVTVILAEPVRAELERLAERATGARLVTVPEAVFQKVASTEH